MNALICAVLFYLEWSIAFRRLRDNWPVCRLAFPVAVAVHAANRKAVAESFFYEFLLWDLGIQVGLLGLQPAIRPRGGLFR